MKKWTLTVLLFLFGVMLAFGGGRTIFRAKASEHWPTAQATVVSSSVETVKTRRNVRFHPDVRYEYTVAGKPYSASTVSFGGNDSGAVQDAQYLTHRYAAGKTVPVHYEPEDPSVACLECGSAGISSYVVMLGGLVLAGVAAWGLVDMLRFAARERRRMGQYPAQAAR